jgi:hypothetical protein
MHNEASVGAKKFISFQEFGLTFVGRNWYTFYHVGRGRKAIGNFWSLK